MFCQLNVRTRESTVVEKLFGKFIKDTYTIQCVSVYKGAPFYKLDVLKGNRCVDWQRVVSLAGKTANRMLVSNNALLPKEKSIGIFEGKKLYCKMMKNTFVQILENNFTKSSISICLIDAKGQCPEFALNLVEFAKSLTVVTENKKSYEKICDEVLEKTGLCIILKSQIDSADVKIDATRNIMTITGEKTIYNIQNGFEFIVPDIYKKLYDGKVDKLQFYSALYELCGVFDLSACTFEKVKLNNHTVDVKSLDTLIKI